MKICLIRHGKTLANYKKIYCGKTDLSLSENGIKEILQLKCKIIYPVADIFITSELKRAKQTLKFLYQKEPDIILKELNEFNFGKFEMKSYNQLKEDIDYQNWLKDYERFVLPDGESKELFDDRIIKGFEKIINLKKNSVVVCHGGVISTIMDWCFPNEKNYYEWQPKCCRGYILELEDKWTYYKL